MRDDKVIPVKVAVRCRPLIPKEINEGCSTCVQFVPGEPQIILGTNKVFTFDYVFSPTTSNETVHLEAANGLVESIFKGYNATILAYGQTGSGKTHSMGGGYDLDETASEEIMGIIPRVIRDVFRGMADRPDFEFSIKVSYLELYKEDLLDLLVPPAKRDKDGVVIREDVGGGIKLHGMTELSVDTMEDTMSILQRGAQGRTVGSTAMNSSSSRSHAIFTLHIERTNKKDSQDFCRCKFHLVDLAGSERQKKTRAEGERFKEGVNINKGLLSLGNVISALGEETSKRGHIPYRDSKLTRLLQDSLGGNSHTLMIACASPADSNMEETLSTLRYADRARKIKNKPIVNRDPQAAEIMRLRQLVQQLQGQGAQLNTSSSTSPKESVPSAVARKEMDRLKRIIQQKDEEIERLNKELHESIDQNAELCEKVIMAESAHEAIKKKLDELKEKNNLHLSKLNSSDVTDDVTREHLQLAESIQQTLLEIEEIEEEEEDDTPPAVSTADAATDITTQDGGEVTCNNTMAEVEREFTAKRAKLGKELQELNKILQKKETLSKQMTESGSHISQMKAQYEEEMKRLEANIDSLQHEKDQLHEKLVNAKSNPATAKLSEQRRRRLKELETEISGLKKKMGEQNKMLKIKDQAEKQCNKLNNEIKSMKQARVRLVKQMKEEAEHFRKWRSQKEKEVMQLKAKDRKRQVEMVKMTQKFSQKEAVLRRKAEQAEAAQKRLKDLINRQKAAREDRNKMDGNQTLPMKERVRKWVMEDMELQVGLEELRCHKEDLVAERKSISHRVANLKAKLDKPSSKKKRLNDSSTKDAENHEAVLKEVKELEAEMDVRSAQIADITQRLMDTDQEDRSKTRWSGIHSLVEAKVVMIQLFKTCVSNTVAKSRSASDAEDARHSCQETMRDLERLQEDMKNMRQVLEDEKDSVQRHCEEKVLYLLQQLNNKPGAVAPTDEQQRELLQFQTDEINKLNHLVEDLDKKSNEVSDLQKELTILKFQNRTGHRQLMPDFNTPSSSFFTPPVTKAQRPKAKAVKRKSEPVTDEEDYFDDEVEDAGAEETYVDPDWKSGQTPGYTYKAQSRQTRGSKTSTSNSHVASPANLLPALGSEAEPSPAPETSSGPEPSSALELENIIPPTPTVPVFSCRCQGGCSSRRCKCRGADARCGDHCKCRNCLNRELPKVESTTEGFEELDSSKDQTDGTLNATFVKEESSIITSDSDTSQVLANRSNMPPPAARRGTFSMEQESLLETSGVKKKRKLLPTKFFSGLS